MLEIDGSFGEGGGQIVRTALAFSTITQQPVRVTNIRSGRSKGGLKNQHLHCIKTLEKLCGAKTIGAELGSAQVEYYPGKIEGKKISIDIGTAGSITLLLQSVLLPCFFADKKVKLEFTGGTNVAWSMPFEYFQEIVVPQIQKYCEKIDTKLLRRGYYPAGGGKVEITITPKYKLSGYEKFSAFCKALNDAKQGIELTEQYSLVYVKGVSHASKSLEAQKVAERQAHSAKSVLAKLNCPADISVEYCDTLSAGSGITLWAVFSKNKDDLDVTRPIRLGADYLGEKRLPAEEVGKKAAEMLLEEICSKAPVDSHLADNLVPWLALFGGKTVVSQITPHLLTNVYVVEKFLGKRFSIDEKERTVSAEACELDAGL